MATDIELFNQHQADARNRLNFLVQSILLLAGGALTASVSVFTGSRTIELTPIQANALANSWWLLMAPCRFVWKATPSLGHRRRERAGRQVLELGHAQVGDGDEVLARPEAARGALGLLQQPVHRLDEGVAAVIDHAAHRLFVISCGTQQSQ